MEAGEGTTGASKRVIRIGEVSRFARTARDHQTLPAAPGETGPGSSPEQDPKRRRLAQLNAFRERGIISEESFRAQTRMQGAHSKPSIVPSEPSPVLPRRTRRWRWRWVVPGFVVLNLAGLGVVGFRVLPPLQSGALMAATMAGTQAAPASPGNVYAPGNAFRLGPYTYTITGRQTAATLDGRFSPASANPGDEYLIVTFSVRNDSAKPRVFSTDAFKLQDANGALYAACGQGAAVPRTELTRGDLLLTEIQPGATKRVAAAFEVPAVSVTPPFKLLVFEQDLLGTHEATVDLRDFP
jgi:hypothetical protein